MARQETNSDIHRAVGLLVIEVRQSNPNGDPDQEGEPRQRSHDQRGYISPVSFKRKLRDLVENKEGPVWNHLASGHALDSDEFQILESRGRNRKEINDLMSKDFHAFQRRYWDGRLFGNTFLEKEGGDTIRTGVVQFGVGISIAPVRIERSTNTSKAGVQEGKDRGMAPLGFKVVDHGVYAMPFFVNPSAAGRSGCTPQDVQLMLELIPHAYSQTMSAVRAGVEIRHAWYMEQRSSLGSCSEFALIDALTPTKKENLTEPSQRWDEYDVPTDLGPLRDRLADFRDLMNDA
jgi:Cas7 group CRISPR-associated protein Csh2